VLARRVATGGEVEVLLEVVSFDVDGRCGDGHVLRTH
jgi:hypothetical protein